ncbi:MAG: hypothetical protein QOC78_287 [Solirubrobacteraceae bacterium]|jgi:hypothetical protein|nr:hypothetical protein [Solirubrobacteraceae bacterium]
MPLSRGRRWIVLAFIAAVAAAVSVVGRGAAQGPDFPYRLPVPEGQQIVITQGCCQAFDHSGAGRWALDFGMNNDPSFPLVAAADGTVLSAHDDSSIRCTFPGWQLLDAVTGAPILDDAQRPAYDGNCWELANYLLVGHGATADLYMHLAPGSLGALKPGDTVHRGQPIARAGTTGWSNGNHLHFQVEQAPCSDWRQCPAARCVFDASATTHTCPPTAGWWFTPTVDMSQWRFGDPDVLAKTGGDGMPRHKATYVSGNAPPKRPAATTTFRVSRQISGGELAAGFGSIWVMGDEVLRLDPASGHVLREIPVPGHPDLGIPGHPNAAVTGFGSVWTGDWNGDSVLQIDPRSSSIIRTIRVGDSPREITVGDGRLWVANYDAGTLSEVDPGGPSRPAHLVRTVPVGERARGVAFGAGRVWVVLDGADQVAEFDPRAGRVVGHLAVGRSPWGVAFGAGRAWVTGLQDRSVTVIDPGADASSAAVVGRIDGGDGPRGIAAGAGGVWVAASAGNAVTHIDPVSLRVVDQIPVADPWAVAVDGPQVWAASYTNTVTRITPAPSSPAPPGNAAPTPSKTLPHGQPSGSKVQPVAWRDREYTTDCHGIAPAPFTVRFSNGFARAGADSRYQHYLLRVQAVVHGDLTGDGAPETAVLLSCSGQPSNFSVQEVQVFTNGTRRFAKLPDLPRQPDAALPPVFDPGLTIRDDHTLVAPMLFYTAGDTHASGPSQHRTVTFRWDGSKFVADGYPSVSSRPDLSHAVITLDGLGPLRIGMSVAEAEAVLHERLDVPYRGTPPCGFARPRSTPPGVSLMFQTSELVRIDVLGATRTLSGAHVGNSDADIERIYSGRIKVAPNLLIPHGHELIFQTSDHPDRELLFQTDENSVVTEFKAGKRDAVEQPEPCL